MSPGGRGLQLNAVNVAFLALSTLAVLLRVYCRAFIVKSFGVDDWLAVVAWVIILPPGHLRQAEVNNVLDFLRTLRGLRYHRCLLWNWPEDGHCAYVGLPCCFKGDHLFHLPHLDVS